MRVLHWEWWRQGDRKRRKRTYVCEWAGGSDAVASNALGVEGQWDHFLL